MPDPAPLRAFIQAMTRLANQDPDEARYLAEGRDHLAALVAQDGWLPEACAIPGHSYRQYLLHCDPLERFSLVSFVWGAGQCTPVHDHTVWGLIGMLRGAEIATDYSPAAPMHVLAEQRLTPGMVSQVSPGGQDIHMVRNAFADRLSISIHCYGGNIGAIRRHAFNPETGAARAFISGYSNTALPNLWDRSAEG